MLELNPHHTLDLIIIDGWLKVLLAVRMMPEVISVFKEVNLKVFMVLRSLTNYSVGLLVNKILDLQSFSLSFVENTSLLLDIKLNSFQS